MNQILPGWGTRETAAALLTLLGLCGCGAESVRSLRQMPDNVYSFEVPADGATVYERIAQRARQRYARLRQATYQPAVSASFFPAQQTGAVSLSNSGGIGLRYILHADIRQTDPSCTKVDIYCGSARYKEEAERWQLWATTPFGGPAPPPEQAAAPPAQQHPPEGRTDAAPTE